MPGIYDGYYTQWDGFRMNPPPTGLALALQTMSTHATQNQALHATPGYKAVNLAGGAFATLFTEFQAHCGPRFTWDGARPRTDTEICDLLDGKSLVGECACFAQALFMLAVLPAPIGLGISPAQIRVHTISNGPNGFVAVHGSGFWPRVYGLGANITKPNHKPVNWPTNLRYWYDHKVLAYNAQYWDPCYGVAYNPANTDPWEYKLIESPGPMVDAVNADGPGGNPFHFRCLHGSRSFGATGPRMELMGPYAGYHP